MTAVEDLQAYIATLSPEELGAFTRTITDPELLDHLRTVVGQMTEGGHITGAPWEPLPHQVPPPGNWYWWLLLAGRGSGKTDADASYFDNYMREHAGHRGRIIAPTIGDAREACIEGPSGILVHNPEVRFNRSWGELYWPNGARARIFGAYTPDDVERLRAGGNSYLDWYEELASWRQLEPCLTQARLGLRLGARPHAVVSTTPKPRKPIRDAVNEATKLFPFFDSMSRLFGNPPSQPRLVITRATTDDNPHLAQHVRTDLMTTYAGTRIGRQELFAELLEDVEGAFWTTEQVEAMRILPTLEDPDPLPHMLRIIVAVDPSWGTQGDECGIIVAGRGADGLGYVLDDCSMRAAPSVWGLAVADAYRRWKADRIVAEVNFQAEQVKLVMKTTDPTLSFKELRASRGKVQRAEPVVALTEQGKIRLAGRFPALEDQMTTWVPPKPGERSDISPDRIDTFVWAFTELMLEGGPASSATAAHRQLPTLVH